MNRFYRDINEYIAAQKITYFKYEYFSISMLVFLLTTKSHFIVLHVNCFINKWCSSSWRTLSGVTRLSLLHLFCSLKKKWLRTFDILECVENSLFENEIIVISTLYNKIYITSMLAWNLRKEKKIILIGLYVEIHNNNFDLGRQVQFWEAFRNLLVGFSLTTLILEMEILENWLSSGAPRRPN